MLVYTLHIQPCKGEGSIAMPTIGPSPYPYIGGGDGEFSTHFASCLETVSMAIGNPYTYFRVSLLIGREAFGMYILWNLGM